MSSDEDIPAAFQAGVPPIYRAPALAILALPHDLMAFVTAMLPPLRAGATTFARRAGLTGAACGEER
jgi:hypothetical protein